MHTYKDAEGRTLKIHPACDAIPYGTDEAMQELAARIKAVGQKRPITTYQGHIINGKRRLRACEIAEVPPIFEELVISDSDERTFEQIVADVVWDEDIHRRHLTPGEKVAGSLALLKTQGLTVAEAARRTGTSRTAVHKAKRLEEQEGIEAVEAVKQGTRKLFAKPKPKPAAETDPEERFRQKSAQFLPEIARFRRAVAQLLDQADERDVLNLNDRRDVEGRLRKLHEWVKTWAAGK